MKLNRKKAVIFDLDGTLVDSMWMWKAIDIEYLARFGLACPDDLQKEIEGMSFSETAVYFKERFRLKESLDEIKNAWIQMSIEKYRKEVTLKPGARAFLEFISGKGLVAGIATSNGRAMVDAVLDSLDIRRYFKVVATACEVAAGKPAGKNAGMTVFAVEDAFSLEMKAEKEQLADYYIRDYYELLDGAAG